MDKLTKHRHTCKPKQLCIHINANSFINTGLQTGMPDCKHNRWSNTHTTKMNANTVIYSTWEWGCSSVIQCWVQHTVEAGLTPWCSKGFFSQPAFIAEFLTVFVQLLRAIRCMNICAHVENPTRWQPYHCLDWWKYKSTLGQPLKMECGCPSGRGIENGYMKNGGPP